jgi:glycerophosphoryl diester phosphodiesterase
MLILAHRGNLEGPDRAGENRLSTVARALALGFGLETDLRRDAAGGLYISHDPAEGSLERAQDHAALWKRHPGALVALNLKELGYEAATLELLRSHGVLAHTFLFDMELIEPDPGATAARFCALDPSVLLAARVSDRGETPARALALPGPYVWLDEMDGPWATPADLADLKAAGRKLIAVSRDLHGAPAASCFGRWDELAAMGVDGICTDWPVLLAQRLGQPLEEA